MSFERVTNLDLGIDSSTCCGDLMYDSISSEYYCGKYKESLGLGVENGAIGKGAITTGIYCGVYKRNYICLLGEERAKKAKADEERRAKQAKADAEEKALFEKIISGFNERIQLNPNDTEAYRSRGIIYCQRGLYDQALNDLNKAIQLDPKDAKAFEGRGMAYCGKKDYNQAIADFTESIRLDPESKNAYKLRGAAYGEKGKHKKSIADYGTALGLDPNDKDIAFALKNVQELNAEKNKRLFWTIFSILLGGTVSGLIFAFVSDGFMNGSNPWGGLVVLLAIVGLPYLFQFLTNGLHNSEFKGCWSGCGIGIVFLCIFIMCVSYFPLNIFIGIVVGALIGYTAKKLRDKWR